MTHDWLQDLIARSAVGEFDDQYREFENQRLAQALANLEAKRAAEARETMSSLTKLMTRASESFKQTGEVLRKYTAGGVNPTFHWQAPTNTASVSYSAGVMDGQKLQGMAIDEVHNLRKMDVEEAMDTLEVLDTDDE